MDSKAPHTLKRLFLILFASVLLAFNINTFVRAGGLIPGGFTGVTLLVQEICWRYGRFHVPFTVINYALNAVPAVFCYRFIGKKFTLYSVLMIAVSSLLTDCMPSMFIGFLTLQDTLLSSIFGGILNAFIISLCLHAEATSGGTDFIAIFISEKYHKDAWLYIFAGNCVILALAGFLFSLDKALYSIIFQFTTTAALSALYQAYQQKTLLIITNKPDEIYTVINDMTHHTTTSFKGLGNFEKKERMLVYSVVTASQVKTLIPAIRKIDSDVFINVLKTEQLDGRFYQRPKD